MSSPRRPCHDSLSKMAGVVMQSLDDASAKDRMIIADKNTQPYGAPRCLLIFPSSIAALIRRRCLCTVVSPAAHTRSVVLNHTFVRHQAHDADDGMEQRNGTRL